MLFRFIFLLVFIFNTTTAQATTIICISGGTGSGKTSVAHILKEQVNDNAVIISQDSYYKDLSYLPEGERAKTNFDHPDSIEFSLLKKHLLELKQGKTIHTPTYDFATHNRTSATTEVKPKDIIIVEGILLLAVPEIRDIADIKIFVDVADDERLLRRALRDVEERGRTLKSVQEQYLATVKPMHLEFVEPSKKFADIIIPHGAQNPVAMDILTTQLEKILLTGGYSVRESKNNRKGSSQHH